MDFDWIDARHIRLVDAIAREGTVTRAATSMRITQSAASHALAEIEQRIGRALFSRRRQMVLTREGERFLSIGRRILVDLNELAQSMETKSADAPPIRVSTECYTCYHWLPTAIASLRLKHPDADVQIVLEATRQPIEALLRGELNLAIVSDPRKNASLLERPLFEDEIVAVSAPHHRFASRDFIRAEDFADETLFTYEISREQSHLFRRVLFPKKISPRAVTPVPLTEAMLQLVSSGLGVAALARWAVAPELASGRLVARRITKAGLLRRWRAVRSKRASNADVLDQFAAITAKQRPRQTSTWHE